ncbi:MAG: hemolysin, partial [Marinilabiliales bacterium]
DFSDSPTLGFVIQAVVITFILLLFGEIIPKVYASRFSSRFALIMAFPLTVLDRFFRPVSFILIRSTSIVNRKFQKKYNLSAETLSEALNISSEELKEDEKILNSQRNCKFWYY